MDNYDKLILGLLLFLISSILTYLFKMRQLYAVTPKLFKVTPVSEDGSLCEIIIFNKGNQVEEEIHVDLDSELKLELLASDSANLKLDKSTLSINRLHKGESISALILVENGILDDSKIIKLSSQETVGKVIKKLEEVPPNYAKLVSVIISFIAIFPIMIYGIKGYESYQTYNTEIELKQIYEANWINLEKYYSSDLRKSYSNQEFPIQYVKTDTKASKLIFEAYNKTAIPLSITVDKKSRGKDDFRYFHNIPVPPMSKSQFSVLVPMKIKEDKKTEYDFSFKFGEEFIYDITYVYSYEEENT